MEILIISKSRGSAGGLRLSGMVFSLIALAAIGASAGVAYWGYLRGGDDMAELVLNNPEGAATVWQREIVSQRQLLNRIKADLAADLGALSSSVGRIQGEVNRLDAVAERVARSSSLDPAEFAFAEVAPLGGPHTQASEAPRWQNLLDNLTALDAEIEMRDSRLTVLESFLLDKQQNAASAPDGRPVQGAWLSSGYGYRTDPVSGRREFHGGIDFAAKPGLEISTVAPGVVTWSGKRWGYGNLVEINHGNGYLTRYAHNRENLVKVGEKVEKNQPIALLGSSGRSTGPHLHFEVVHNNRNINPWQFIRRHLE